MINEQLPQVGDIWRGENEDYFLILSEPKYCNDEQDLSMTVMWFYNGSIDRAYFSVDEKTGTLNEWWIKIA